MSDIMPTTPAQSPFDAIKRTRPDGGEYWSARDLMPLMGYTRWENLQIPLERAMKSAKNQKRDLTSNFLRSQKISGTKPAEDYELSKYGAHLVAMNGDPNKPEIAAAQEYFSVQAEVAEKVQSMSTYDILRAQIDQLEAAERTANEAKAIAQRTEARLDSIEGRHDWYSALGYARVNGIQQTSAKTLRKVGAQASAIAKGRGIEAVKVYSEIFGEVNSYPAWVWESAFDALGIE